MSRKLSPILLKRIFEAESNPCHDREHLVSGIEKAGFLADRDDPHGWRAVIDEALRDAEAAIEQSSLPETVLKLH